MKKILFITVIVAVLSFSFCFAASKFSDVNGTKYESAVTLLTNNGVIDGFTDGTFRPQSNVTRAQLCKLLVEALQLKRSNNSVLTQFKDVDSSMWFYEYVKIAVDHGIIIGYTDGTFKPNNDVSYAEMFTMIIRAMGKENQITNKSDWPNAYITYAINYGLLSNVAYSGNDNPAIRGEVSIALYNMVNRLEDETGTTKYGFVDTVSTRNKISYAKINGVTYTVSSKSSSFTEDTYAVFEYNSLSDEIKLIASYGVKDLDAGAEIVTYVTGKTGAQEIKIKGSSKYIDYFTDSNIKKFKSYGICVIDVEPNSKNVLEVTKYSNKSTIENVKFEVGDRIIENSKYGVFLVFKGLDEDDEITKGKYSPAVEYAKITYAWDYAQKPAGVSLPKSETVEVGTRYYIQYPSFPGLEFYAVDYSTNSFIVKGNTTIYLGTLDYRDDDDDQGGHAGSNIPLIDRVSESKLKAAVKTEWQGYIEYSAYGSDVDDLRIRNIKIYAGDDKDSIKFGVSYELHPSSSLAINRLTAASGQYDEESGWVIDKYNSGILYAVDDDNDFYIDYSSVGTGW